MIWKSLPLSTRIAACAFVIHALLLVVDLAAFNAAYGANRPSGLFMPVLRIVAFGLFTLGLLRAEPRPWLIGFFVLAAFLLRDVAQLKELYSDPAASTAQQLLNAALFATITTGVLSLLLPAIRRLVARRS